MTGSLAGRQLGTYMYIRQRVVAVSKEHNHSHMYMYIHKSEAVGHADGSSKHTHTSRGFTQDVTVNVYPAVYTTTSQVSIHETLQTTTSQKCSNERHTRR